MKKYFRKFRAKDKFCGRFHGKLKIRGLVGYKDGKVIFEITDPNVKAMLMCCLRDTEGFNHYCLTDGEYWLPLKVEKEMEWGKGYKYKYKPDPNPEVFLSVVEKSWIEETAAKIDTTLALDNLELGVFHGWQKRKTH